MGKNQKAIENYKKSIQIDPSYADGYYGLGIVYISLGQKQKAKENLQKAKSIFQEQGDEASARMVEQYLNQLP